MVCRCVCGFRVFLSLFFINFLLFRLIFFFFFFFFFFFSGYITIRINTLRTQLFLEFSTDHFETMCTLSINVHVVFSLSPPPPPPPPPFILYHFFPTFSTQFLPGLIRILIDTLWAQLLLVFSTDHFQTMRTRST